jgi:cytochrome c553
VTPGRRHYLIGAGLGVLALAMMPLAGLVRHDATGWPGLTGWYHWLAVRQSVTLRSLTVTAPPLEDPARARRAAGHYQLVCAKCHGSPAAEPARFAADLWPEPPRLAEATARWRPPARLFRTVKSGIRRTGMPGWPVATRDDEVWDMVAFLTRLPELSAEEYQQAAGQGRCTDCHGTDGEGRDGIPRLDIQTPEFIAGALRAFRAGTRASGTMISVARSLTDARIEEFAREFGRDVERPTPGMDGSHAARIATVGLPERDIPACLSCHGSGSRGDHPALAGQDADYLRRQLTLFADLGEGRGGQHAQMMAHAARWLRPEDIDALAAWFGQ